MQTNHTEKDARFIILHSAFCSEIPNPLIQKNTQPWKWIYLGRKYKNMCVWEEKMPPHCSKLPISERLEKTAHALKEPFIAAVARMGLKYNSIAWWVSRFSERNITVSPLFLYCCYLRLALDIIEKSKDNICKYDHTNCCKSIIC